MLYRSAILCSSFVMLAACSTSPVVPSYQSSAEARSRLEQLQTADEAEIQRRWGDLAKLEGKSWLHSPDKGAESMGADLRWVVRGAVMRIAVASCNKPECLRQWTVQYNPANKQLDFIKSADNRLDMVGIVQSGGWVLAKSQETLSLDKWLYHPHNKTLTIGGAFTYQVYSEVSRDRLTAAMSVLRDVQTPATVSALARAATPLATKADRNASLSKGSVSTNAIAANEPARPPVADVQPWAKPKPGSFGPFDNAFGNVYIDEMHTLVAVNLIREQDGALTISRQVMSAIGEYPPEQWRFRATRKPGVYEVDYSGRHGYTNNKGVLLPNGVLQMQSEYVSQDGKEKRLMTEWRLTPASLNQTVSYSEINADGTLGSASQPSTDIFAASTQAVLQAKYRAALELEANNRRALAERRAARNSAPPPPTRSFAEIFATTFQQEMRNKQVQDAKQQAFLNNLARETRAIERERERAYEKEWERADEARRRAVQVDRADRGQASTYSPDRSTRNEHSSRSVASTASRSTQAALNDADRRSTVSSSSQTAAASASAPTTVAGRDADKAASARAEDYWAARRAGTDHAQASGTLQRESRGRAGAWCIKIGEGFKCMGPFQTLWAPEKPLELALRRVGCEGGKGYTPTTLKGEYFDCGRELGPTDKKMPTYDPYANYKK